MTAPVVRLSVVIPAFNEAPRIARTIAELDGHLRVSLPDYEIRVVDDGSEDGTAAIVAEIARGNARVVLQREPHHGKGRAVRAGLLAATGELRFMCDADLSMPVHELARLLTVVPSQADIAVASREGPGARRVGEPAHRHLLGRVFNRVIRGLSLSDLDDTQCGFKLFTAAAVAAVVPATTLDGWAFDVEMLFIARLRGLRTIALPVEWHYRELSQVSPVRDPIWMLRDLVRIRLNAARGRYAATARGARQRLPVDLRHEG